MSKPSGILKYQRIILSFTIILLLLIIVLVGFLAEKAALTSAKKRMQNTLAFQSEILNTSMDKYAILSALIARRPDIISALSHNDSTLESLPKAKQLAATFAGLSGATDVWVANTQGNILVGNQSSQQIPNISNKLYYQRALQGNLGRASAVTNTGQRLYIFASPVFGKEKIIGVIIIRVDLEYLEQVWVLLEDPILATDRTGRILVSSIKSWGLKYFSPPHIEAEGASTRDQFLVKKLYSNNQAKISLRLKIDNTSGHDYLQVFQSIPLLGWRIHVMTSYDTILKQRNLAVLIALLISTLIIMTIFMWMSRQRRSMEEQRSQQAFSLRLERQVRDRTQALTAANKMLKVEIDERRNAEKSLRETQEELVQAAKLAGIGQMSAALAHEYNQPLTAIRSYADNATIFLHQNKPDAISDNLQRINMLVDKMASLTGTLRSFAYKANHNIQAISLDAVMDELAILLSPQAKKQQVSLHFLASPEPLYVAAEHSRLSQVITNLVTNAMDAVDNTERSSSQKRKVEISWVKQQSNAIISVKDTGPGISKEAKEKMFDAFYTTKGPGDGLGLGLFIVLNIINDLKGNLEIKKESGYGGVFEITLPLANKEKNS